MAQHIEKPVLVLGVDGVLLTVNEERPPAAEQYYADDAHTFCYPDHALWLAPVLQQTDAWYLSANSERSDAVGKTIGLPWIPWLDYTDFAQKPGDDFRRAIDHTFEGRPLAWIDNTNHANDRRDWAEARTAKKASTLLIAPDGERGLQREHVDMVLEWLGQIATAQKR